MNGVARVRLRPIGMGSHWYMTLMTLGALAGCSDAMDVGIPPSPSITVTPDRGTVDVGARLPLTAQVGGMQADSASTVVWASSDPAVASVRASGPRAAVVQGLANGQVTITATAGSTTWASSPITVGVVFTKLAAGHAHVCGLTESGAAYCWGANQSGQLGDGITEPRNRPTKVTGGLSFTSISAGPAHTCAVTADHRAFCWGDNSQGRLGDGTTAARLEPTAVSGGIAFRLVSAGRDHTCGIDVSGVAYCWGNNNLSQLGDGSTTARSVPSQVSSPAAFSTIAAGASQTCGVALSGTTYCWGTVLGYGPTPTPVQAAPPLVSLTVNRQACGLTGSGETFCWGANPGGGPGPGSSFLIPAPIAGGVRFASVAVGDTHTCGVTAGGAAYCWGENSSGQLGDGTFTSRNAPVLVGGGYTFAAIAAGSGYSCALTAMGSPVCWGGNGSGQLGNGTLVANSTLFSGEYFPLDGTINDEGAGAFHATVFGAAQFTADRFGRPGSALLFNGSTDSLGIPAAATNSVSAGTITFWLALNNLDANYVIFAKPLHTPCRTLVNAGPNLPCDYAMEAKFESPPLSQDVDRFFFQLNGDQRTYVSPAVPDFTSWHMYTFTWSGGRKHVYFDGAPLGDAFVAERLMPSSGDLTFGTQSFPRTDLLSGALDDITIYHRELTEAEVATLNSASAPAPLRELARRHGRLIGSAFDAFGNLTFDVTYRAHFAREFSVLTPENAMKFGPIQPEAGRFDFSRADSQVAFAAANGISVRGHTLAWNRQWPEWAMAEAPSWDRSTALSRLKQHITTVVDHFRGRVAFWDVVNEAVCDDGSLASGCLRGGEVQTDFWLDKIGPEYIDSAFTWAHQADPGATLFYNDYGIEGSTIKADSALALLRRLRDHGVPIQGVGFQSHFDETNGVPATFAANMKRFTDLGIEVHLTEMEFRVKVPSTPQSLADQAKAYNAIAQACLANPSCTAMVMWGFTDARSWIPSRYPGWGDALIFNSSFQAKPAFGALYEALK